MHDPRIWRFVERACNRHRIQYDAHRNLFAGAASQVRWLRRMGRPLDFSPEPA